MSDYRRTVTTPTPAPATANSGLGNWLNNLPRDKSDTLLLLMACSMVLLPHVEHLPGWTSLACALLLAWRGAITLRGRRLPPISLLLPLALLTMLGVYASSRTLLGREAGVTMLVLLLTFKLLEMRARRDLFVVLFLSFFLILTTFFYSQSIATALFVVATLIVLLTAQLSFQFTGAVPRFQQRLRMGAFILALAIPLTLVLFLLFPRIQGPLWGMPGDAHAGHSGMSDSMTPGNISQLALSDEIAFRIKFIDPAPAPAKRYWRGAVLSNFDGRTWTQRGASAQFSSDSGALPNEQKSGAAVRQQITMEASGQRWLFALETPQAAPTLETGPAGQSHISGAREILSDQPINERIRYDVTSAIDTHGPGTEAAAILRQALILPDGFNPRALAFAAGLRSQSTSDAQVVNAVLSFFRHEKFSYTLEPPLLGRDSVDDFLFSSRAGFCEHYSSAFVVLMRAAHIPARVVTGYQGGAINPVDGFMTVRQSDAHAWAEVWLAARGWVRVDPTAAVAPERIQMNLNQVLPHGLLGGLFNLNPSPDSWWNKLQIVRANWDAVGNAWNQWVLNYTPERQKNLLQYFGLEQLDWRMLTALMFGLGTLALAAVTLPLLLIRQRPDPLDKLYLTLSKRMVRHSMGRQIHEGPHAYRRRLCAASSPLTPQTKNAVSRFLKLYETLRYGADSGTDTVAPVSFKNQFKKLKYLLSQCR